VKRSLTVLSLVLAVLGLVLSGCGGDDEAATTAEAATTTEESTTAGGGGTIEGSVGPGFEISVEGASNLSAGLHTLVVHDRSTSHNFHLTGPNGVDVSTAVDAEGEESFEVDLAPGEYTFVCDPHASSMNGSFTVG
jgi:plastocyanin